MDSRIRGGLIGRLPESVIARVASLRARSSIWPLRACRTLQFPRGGHYVHEGIKASVVLHLPDGTSWLRGTRCCSPAPFLIPYETWDAMVQIAMPQPFLYTHDVRERLLVLEQDGVPEQSARLDRLVHTTLGSLSLRFLGLERTSRLPRGVLRWLHA